MSCERCKDYERLIAKAANTLRCERYADRVGVALSILEDEAGRCFDCDALCRPKKEACCAPTVSVAQSLAGMTQLIEWLDKEVRRCDHGYIHITCGTCNGGSR